MSDENEFIHGDDFILDGNDEIVKVGDRVYSFDFDGTACYGVLCKNKDNPEVSQFYIQYDDGEDCAVLDISIVFKSDEPLTE